MKKQTVEVVETRKVVDLILRTKKPMRPLDTLHGTLYQGGEFLHKFTEDGAGPQNTRPWECHVKLAEEKPYARISANSNGGFLFVYAPRVNFSSNRELIEIFLDQTERLCEKMESVDAIAIIEKLDALKRELSAA
jgi:hypothetical protein